MIDDPTMKKEPRNRIAKVNIPSAFFDSLSFWSQIAAAAFVVIALLASKESNKRQSRQILTLGRELQEAKRDADTERITRLEMEKTLAPREFVIIRYTPEKTNVDVLMPFSGMQMIVQYVREIEAERAAFGIVEAAETAGWKLVRAEPKDDLRLPMYDGVSIQTFWALNESSKSNRMPTDEERLAEKRSVDAATALIGLLKSKDWKRVRRGGPSLPEDTVPINTVRIKVGFKPSPYFEPKELKELHKKFREDWIKGDEEMRRKAKENGVILPPTPYPLDDEE